MVSQENTMNVEMMLPATYRSRQILNLNIRMANLR